MAGIWQNLRDHFILSAMHSPLGGEGIARGIYRLKGYSNDQINRAIDAESSEIEQRHKNDKGFVNGATSLLGSLLGGVDPTYVLGAGGTGLVSRAARQAAVQGAASGVRQGVEIGTGQRQKVDAKQVVTDMTNGAAFQGGADVTGRVIGAVARSAKSALPRIISGKTLKEGLPEVQSQAPLAPDGLPGNGSVRPMDPKTIATIMNDPEAAGMTGINDNTPARRLNGRDMVDVHPDTVAPISEADLQELPPANQEYLRQQQLQAPITPEASPPPVLTEAEMQDYDASAPTIPLDNTGYEAHTPYIENPPVPANDTGPVSPDIPPKGPGLLEDESGAFTPWGKKSSAPDLKDIPEEELTPEQRVMLGIRAADPVREAQEAQYRVERAKRFEAAKNIQHVADGEAGFHQELKNLEGPMEQLPSPYSIRPNLSQTDVDSLYNQIANHPALSYTDSIHARTGLQKLLANSGASVPTRSELDVLRKVFPEDPKASKKSITSWITDAINAPRSIMASMDLSAPLRQGLPMIHRKEFWTSFGSMMKQLGNEVTGKGEDAFDAIRQDISSRPSYHLMRDSGLSLSDVDADLSHHEEKFLSNLATQIPIFGHVVKGSERLYVGFLNKLRADTFDTLINNARDAGKKLTPTDIKSIANYINTATGRGDLNRLVPKIIRGEFDVNEAAPLMAGVFFSPRLMASRFAMLNPVYYAKLSPIARQEAFKSLASTIAFTTTSLSLAHMAGLKVGYDPRQTDFGKIRVGHTTYDMTGGFASYIRYGAQMLSGERLNPDGTKTAMPNRIDTTGNFLRNKESPPLSLTHSIMKGVDNDFQKVDRKHLGNIAEDVGKDFVPLVAQDTYGVYKSDGAKQAAISAVPDLFGIGVNTYVPKAKTSRKKKFADFNKGFGGSFKDGF